MRRQSEFGNPGAPRSCERGQRSRPIRGGLKAMGRICNCPIPFFIDRHGMKEPAGVFAPFDEYKLESKGRSDTLAFIRSRSPVDLHRDGAYARNRKERHDMMPVIA